jgi:hypothetical protein
MEKYEKETKAARKIKVDASKRELLVTFLAELEGDKYDSLSFDDLNPSVNDHPEGAEVADKDVFDHHKDHKENTARVVSEQDFSRILFIKSVPVNFKRAEIVEVYLAVLFKALSVIPGFVHVDLTEPTINKNFVRNGFITLEDKHAVDAFVASHLMIKVLYLINVPAR